MYPLYIAGIIFIDCYIWGLMLMYFSITQIIIHGVVFNIKMGSIYNPGVATMMLILIPVGIYYIWYVASHFSLAWWYYLAAGVLLMPVSFCSLMLPIKLLADKDSKHIWSKEESEKFHVMEKVR